MSNKAFYKKMMDEVSAPSELLGKVMENSMKQKSIKRMSMIKRVASLAAIFVAVLAVSNGICYAATGHTWLEHATVFINGHAYDMDIEFMQNGDTTIGTLELEVDEAASEVVVFTGGTEYTFDTSEMIQIITENGRQYLTDHQDVKIDITEDLADKTAAGTYEKDGLIYQYEVTVEDEESYNINILSVTDKIE